MRAVKLATKKRRYAPIRSGERPPPSEWKRPTSSRKRTSCGRSCQDWRRPQTLSLGVRLEVVFPWLDMDETSEHKPRIQMLGHLAVSTGPRVDPGRTGVEPFLLPTCRGTRSRPSALARPRCPCARPALQPLASCGRAAGDQKYEVAYESKKTRKSASAVKKAVKKVGNVRGKVEKKLARTK